VRRVHARLGRAFVVVSEGIVNERGEYIAAQGTVDAFGHRQLGGVAALLQQHVTEKLGLKCRYNRLDTCQRNAMHFASKTDSDEAYHCGQEAVRRALAGESGYMVSLIRESDSPYRCHTGVTPLSEVANGVKKLPRSFMNQAGTNISAEMKRYASPLLVGEAPIRIAADGLPEFVRFQRISVPRKLPAFSRDR
jgi:6-phosphofructokinase 1